MSESQPANRCAGCPLEGVSIPSDPVLVPRSRFVIVTDTPTKFAAEQNRLLSAGASKFVAGQLSAYNFKKADFSFVPQIRCPHEEDSYTTKEKTAIRSHCRTYMAESIARVKPECIIPLGAEPTRQVVGRAVKITKVRGILEYSTEFKSRVFPLLNPNMVRMYPQHAPTFTTDIATLKSLSDNRYDLQELSDEKLGEYHVVEDLQFLIDKNPKLLAFDIEATGLSYFHEGTSNVRDYREGISGVDFNPDAAVLTMQFCVTPGEAYMLVWDHPENPIPMRRKKKLKEQLRQLLGNPKTRVVGQNLKYDRVFVRNTLGVDFRVGGDTLMLATLLDENQVSKGQDMLVKQHVPEMASYADNFNAKHDKGRMWEVPLDEMLDYGCGDADSCLRLYKVLVRRVREDIRLFKHYVHVSLPGLNAMALMESVGLHVDEEALDELQTATAEAVEEQRISLLSQVPRSIKRLHAEAGVKFSRPDFVRDILFNHKDGLRLKPQVFTKTTAKLEGSRRVPSISTKEHLPYFYEDYPFVVELAEHIKTARLLGTNIVGFRSKYIVDGMVRPTYSLTTAVTGRSSSEKPNGQNFPKRGKLAKAYRRVYVAPEGYFMVEADLSQAELRISADMANEKVMLAIYRSGGDIHKATALIVMGITMAQFNQLSEDEQGLARFKAKAVNFGFIYGMGWRKFIGYAKTQYGVEFSEEEAQRIRNEYFRRYPALVAWHKRYRELANRDKQVRSYSGRIRHLPMIDSDEDFVKSEAERQAINSPVQEFGSSLGVMALGRMAEEIDPYYITPVAFVHDAIYCYVKKEYLDWGVRTLKWYMESNPIEEWFGLKMKCPIVADVSFGENMGDTYELKGLQIDEPYDFSKLFEPDDEKRIIIPRQLYPENDGLLKYA